MGVKNLLTYLTHESSPTCKEVTGPIFQRETWCTTPGGRVDPKRVVVVDYGAFVYAIVQEAYPQPGVWQILGGQYAAIASAVRSFVGRFEKVGASLVFVVGSTPCSAEHGKHAEMIARMSTEYQFKDAMARWLEKNPGRPFAEDEPTSMAPMKFDAVLDAVLDQARRKPDRVEVVVCAGEDDPCVAYEAKRRQAWILTNDTDLLMYDYSSSSSSSSSALEHQQQGSPEEPRGVVFFSAAGGVANNSGTSNLEWKAGGELHFSATHPRRVAEALGVPRALLSVTASTVGNDYVALDSLTKLHDRAICRELARGGAQHKRWYDLAGQKERESREAAVEAERQGVRLINFPCRHESWCTKSFCKYSHPSGGRFLCRQTTTTTTAAIGSSSSSSWVNSCTRPYTCFYRHVGERRGVVALDCRFRTDSREEGEDEARRRLYGELVRLALEKLDLLSVCKVETTAYEDEFFDDEMTMKLWFKTVREARLAATHLGVFGSARLAREWNWAVIRGVSGMVGSEAASFAMKQQQQQSSQAERTYVLDHLFGAGDSTLKRAIVEGLQEYVPREARLPENLTAGGLRFVAQEEEDPQQCSSSYWCFAQDADSRARFSEQLTLIRDKHLGRLYGRWQRLPGLLEAERYRLCHGTGAGASAWVRGKSTGQIELLVVPPRAPADDAEEAEEEDEKRALLFRETMTATADQNANRVVLGRCLLGISSEAESWAEGLPLALRLALGALRFWLRKTAAIPKEEGEAAPEKKEEEEEDREQDLKLLPEEEGHAPPRLALWQLRVLLATLVQRALEMALDEDDGGDEKDEPRSTWEMLDAAAWNMTNQWAHLLRALRRLATTASLRDPIHVPPQLFDGNLIILAYSAEASRLRGSSLDLLHQSTGDWWARRHQGHLTPTAPLVTLLLDQCCTLLVAGLETSLAPDNRRDTTIEQHAPSEEEAQSSSFQKLTLDDCPDSWDDDTDDDEDVNAPSEDDSNPAPDAASVNNNITPETDTTIAHLWTSIIKTLSSSPSPS